MEEIMAVILPHSLSAKGASGLSDIVDLRVGIVFFT